MESRECQKHIKLKSEVISSSSFSPLPISTQDVFGQSIDTMSTEGFSPPSQINSGTDLSGGHLCFDSAHATNLTHNHCSFTWEMEENRHGGFELGLTCKAHVLHSCVAVLIKGEAFCICSTRRRMTEKQTPLGKTHFFPLKHIRLISYQNYC